MTDIHNVTADELHDFLLLDAKTGILRWKFRPISMFSGSGWMQERAWKTWNARFADSAMTVGPMGYVRLSINGRALKAHRVVWAMIYGKWPDGVIDHINGDTSDNRPENLRDVSHAENCRNQKQRSTNKTGRTGVSINARVGNFEAHITADGKHIHLGYFEDFRNAVTAREQAEKNYGFHPNHARSA